MELNLDWRREQSAQWPEVSYELRPLRVWAFHELLAHWHTAAPEGDPPRANPAHGAGLMAVAKRILPDHVRGLEGVLLVQGGQRVPAPLDALCDEAALMPLASEIVARLVAITELPSGAEKN